MEALRLSRRSALLFTRTTLRHTTTTTPLLHQRPYLRPFSPSTLTPRLPRHRLPTLRAPRSHSKHLLTNKPTSPGKPSTYDPTPSLKSPPSPSLSLSQRLRKLSREYGWSAVGVYFALSTLDFPFCFTAVRWLGTERIGAWEHQIVEWVKRAVPVQVPHKYRFWEREAVVEGGEGLGEGVGGYDHGVREAEVANTGEKASIWTQLALAYAVHKSFIFIRVPLTAAITPKVVRVLRGWGWDIGKRKSKSVAAGAGTKSVKKD
ncbi:hypothetical protein MMC30_000719 [Trapelia coarctata]|nr:hypothetical protein [Trapelia coarctata]